MNASTHLADHPSPSSTGPKFLLMLSHYVTSFLVLATQVGRWRTAAQRLGRVTKFWSAPHLWCSLDVQVGRDCISVLERRCQRGATLK